MYQRYQQIHLHEKRAHTGMPDDLLRRAHRDADRPKLGRVDHGALRRDEAREREV